MGKYYIGFDAGTQSVKVVMYSLEMECIAEANYPTFFEYPHPGWVQMNVDEYLEAVKKGIRDVVNTAKEKGIDPSEVRAIFGDGIICLIVFQKPSCKHCRKHTVWYRISCFSCPDI